MKKPKFPQRIVVAKEENPDESTYDVILGSPDLLTELDAENGQYVAIYTLVGVHKYETNPRLK